MNPQANSPLLHPAAINERVTAGIRSHRLRMRILTSLALLFGFLALATSLGLAWSYFVFILPRQTEMMQEGSQAFVHHSGTNTVSEPLATQEALQRIERHLRMEAQVSRTLGLGTFILAIAVGALGLGTLVLLLVVILNRRAGLNQLNVSLAEISRQLREASTPRANPPPS